MLEIIIQGRGGQGAQTAGNLLAGAFHAQGLHVQCFASYGGARRGTPVNSYIRADQRPVRVRCDIERADAILCFDSSLLEGRLLAAADDNTLIVVNSARSAAEFAQALPGKRVIPIDALAISRQQGLGRIVNSALLGALARVIQAPTLEILSRALVFNFWLDLWGYLFHCECLQEIQGDADRVGQIFAEGAGVRRLVD